MVESILETKTIGGKEYSVKLAALPQQKLKFYPENPRIYSLMVTEEGEEPDQLEIEKKLSQMEHVKQLIQSIKANGGVLEPLIVRDGDYVVLEGNSRLAAYRVLAKGDPIKWGRIKCELLPGDITDDAIATLLGEYHIVGRKDWAPYEQAGHLWRRNKKHNIAIEVIAQELGISIQKIRHLVNVYDFMVENNEQNSAKWSYYDEYLKSRFVQQKRSEYPNLDNVFVKKIKKNIIPKAEDVREKVTMICKVGGKTLNTFMCRETAFDECYKSALDRGVDNHLLQRIKKFKELVFENDTKTELLEMEDTHYKKSIYELKKISQRLEVLVPAVINKRGE
jgi:hypothetical protein